MADSPATVALNIGSQRIGMAVFESSKSGGLVLKAYDSESIVSDPALDASRVSQTRIAIASLAKRLKIGKAKVRYAISGQAVITRFVKLPPLGGDNIEQLVTFEAQQQFPFPLNEVVWDYELIESPGEKEVVIVAIKSDALDEINAAVNESGLSTAEVDVAPMALFNAFRAAYGEPSESVLLIDIGARTTNLLYLEGKRFFTRSVGISGSAITAAIAKEYGIPFLEAEGQKVSNGLVALGGGHTEQLDESVAHLAGVIRNALTRLPAEIARTTNYYRSQHGGSAPSRVIIAGGGANLPYTLEFFQEKLNLPVEYFNPLGAFTVGKGADSAVVQREGHLMGELVGLGLRGIGKSTINIDLVPTVVEQARAADRRKPFLIGAAAALLLGVGAWAGLQWAAAGKAEEKLQSTNDTREQLDPIATEIRTLLDKEKAIRKVAVGYTTAEADHAFWYDLLSEIRGAFASEYVWLTDLEPLADYQPPIEAKAAGAKGAAAPDPKAVSGKSMIRPEFFSTGYGQSSLIAVEREARPGVAAQPINTVNAIRVKGFWRANDLNQNLVSELLKKLRDNPGSFAFSFPGADGKPVNLKDEQILKVTVANAGPDLAFPFEITLPLAREVKAK
jgi:type IV pilus assembly protein PilM